MNLQTRDAVSQGGVGGGRRNEKLLLIIQCLRKYVSKFYLPSAIKSTSSSHQVFGVFALLIEVNKTLQATPSKLRREMGMCTTAIHVQQQHGIIRAKRVSNCYMQEKKN